MGSKLVRYSAVLVLGLMLTLPPGLGFVVAQETAPPEPVAAISEEERAAFIAYWMDVFVHGTIAFDEARSDYNYNEYLQGQLVQDLVAAVKAYDPEIAAQFAPEIAGPLFGLSTEENPLVGPNGEEVTQGMIDEVYAGFFGGLIFNRAEFTENLKKLVAPAMPGEDDFIDPPSGESYNPAENEIRQAFMEEPLKYWANDLENPVMPEGFVETTLPELMPVELPESVDITDDVAISPFTAGTMEEWTNPEFQMTLPRLLDFLSTLTDLPAGDILHELGLLSEVVETVVPRIEGTLDAFPEVATPIADLELVQSLADDLVTTINAPLPITIRLDGERAEDLPPEVQAMVDEMTATAGSTAWYATVNGVQVDGTWGAPSAVDVDGDNVPDVIVHLSMAPATTTVGEGGLLLQPKLTLDRIDTPSVPPQPPTLPELALTYLDLQIVYQIPDTETLVAYVITLGGGASHLEATLVDTGPSVDLATVSPSGAFAFAAATIAGGEQHILTATAPAAPASLSLSARSNVAAGTISIDATPGAPAALAVGAIGVTPTGRLAASVSGAELPAISVDSNGADVTIDTAAGTTFTFVRQEPVGLSLTQFTSRAMTVVGASESTQATLSRTNVAIESDDDGASITTTIGDVSNGAYLRATWTEVLDAGESYSLTAAVPSVSFTSDSTVARVRAVVATTSAAALTGALAQGMFRVRGDLVAFSLNGGREIEVAPEAGGYVIDINGASGAFLLDSVLGGDAQSYLFSNLARQTTVDVTPKGISVGASDRINGVVGNLMRTLDGRAAPQTRTILSLANLRGNSAFSMDGATVNAFAMGTVGQATMLSSNVVNGAGQHVFAALSGNHALGDANGLLEQHSASLTGATGSLVGGLFGPLGHLTIELGITGPFCLSFGHGATSIELCISNVPSRIEIGIEAIPNPKITYDASAIINSITMRVVNPGVNLLFTISQIPKHIEAVFQAGQLTLSTDTRLGGLSIAATIGDTTISAGIQDLPRTLTMTWGTGGLTPSMPAGDAIGRLYLFVSKPGLQFFVDLVHIPPTVISWNAGAISLGPVGDRIGRATVQLFVSDLSLSMNAVGIPGVTLTFGTGGGTISTNNVLDSITLTLMKGPWWAPQVYLYAGLVYVPRITAGTWSNGGLGLTFSPSTAKITSATFDFRALDLRLYAQATGIPTLSLSTSGGGFSLNAPNGLDSLTLIAAKGPGYYDPNAFGTDFLGVYLRPDSVHFGVSAKFTGIKSLAYSKTDATRTQAVSLGFVTDKTIRMIADLDSSVLTALADLVISNLAATTTFSITPDGVVLSGTPVNPWRPTPWLQARVYVGTPSAYDVLPEPRWPYETAGLVTGIMGNTMLDTTTGGIATKWKVFAPLPNVLSFTKSVVNGVPTSYSLNTGVSLGKLDLRTNVKVNLNLCGWCAPYYLDTLVVAYISNLPTSLTLSQGLGSGGSSGTPSFTVNTAQSINDIFLGIRFDNQWYGSANQYGGFPIWASVSQIPTTLSLSLGKSGGWGSGNTPYFGYYANSNTLDARFYLNIGQLWTLFGKPTIINAANAGRAVPGWLVGLAQMDAKGHLYIEVLDVPGSGISIYRSGDTFVVDPLGSTPLTKFFADFNLRLERNWGNSGCWLCGAIRLDWWWSFGYFFEINELSLLLENLRYVSVEPALETIVVLDGHLVFHFRASVGINFSAGIRLSLQVLGLNITILCICVPSISLSVMVDPGFMTFQVSTYTWSLNYWTWAYPCHVSWSGASWCHDHEYVGVTYTIPDHWAWDLPIAWPPLVPFRGLNLYSGTHHVIMNPRILNCVNNFCWEVGRLIPVWLVVAWAFLKYFSISGIQWWSTHHHH